MYWSLYHHLLLYHQYFQTQVCLRWCGYSCITQLMYPTVFFCWFPFTFWASDYTPSKSLFIFQQMVSLTIGHTQRKQSKLGMKPKEICKEISPLFHWLDYIVPCNIRRQFIKIWLKSHNNFVGNVISHFVLYQHLFDYFHQSLTTQICSNVIISPFLCSKCV